MRRREQNGAPEQPEQDERLESAVEVEPETANDDGAMPEDVDGNTSERIEPENV